MRSPNCVVPRRKSDNLPVLLTNAARLDLRDLHAWVLEHDGPARAGRLLDRIEQAFLSLRTMSERGPIVKELRDVGVSTFRELHVKPHRIIYRITPDGVIVSLITDGRRSMQTLLQQRLLSD